MRVEGGLEDLEILGIRANEVESIKWRIVLIGRNRVIMTHH